MTALQGKQARALREGLLKRIHVNQHVIRRNLRDHDFAPPITVKTSSVNIRCFGVQIDGPSRLVYSPEKPLSCGARLWVETRAVVHPYDGPPTANAKT